MNGHVTVANVIGVTLERVTSTFSFVLSIASQSVNYHKLSSTGKLAMQ